MRVVSSIFISHKVVPNIIFQQVTLNCFKVIHSVNFESLYYDTLRHNHHGVHAKLKEGIKVLNLARTP
jgi:hypothetical protein